MIETHAHLYDEAFVADRPAMLERAFAAGVTQLWMPNCDSSTVDGMLELADRYPGRCLPMMGLHPTYVNEHVARELEQVEAWLDRRPFIAIGEIGLDYYWDLTYAEAQKEAFVAQLWLAGQRDLPVVIHCRSGHDRDAFADVADLIGRHGGTRTRGIFHCFTGTRAEAERAIELGFLLGIGGVATFKNGGLDGVIPHFDLRHFVLETDAPYLAPVPHRGTRNEPAHLPLIAQRLADLQGLSLQEVVRQTTNNARSLLEPLGKTPLLTN
jgi:TatD DNase family protein